MTVIDGRLARTRSYFQVTLKSREYKNFRPFQNDIAISMMTKKKILVLGTTSSHSESPVSVLSESRRKLVVLELHSKEILIANCVKNPEEENKLQQA